MKSMQIVKALGFALALAGVMAPSIIASTGPVLAREGNGGAGGGAGGAGGGGGGNGGGEGDRGPGPTRFPPRHPGGVIARDFDRNSPDCFRYRRGMYSYYGYRIPLRCQPYLTPRAYDFD